jgi:hypothetical protein
MCLIESPEVNDSAHRMVAHSMVEGASKGLLAEECACLLELEIKHKHGGFNINYEKATVVWQQFGFRS